jgi:hypothetical protein
VSSPTDGRGDTAVTGNGAGDSAATEAKLWGITDDELKVIQETLAETGKSRRKAKEEDEDL